MLSRLRFVGRAIAVAANRQVFTLPKTLGRTFLTVRAKPTRISTVLGPSVRCFSAYPSHKVLDMPNLSPTMTKGTITKWYKKEGDSFNPGDVICDVETDKATVGFEMVDSGVLAKILTPEGTKDIPLGAPVAVVVDEASDVAAFKDFKPEETKKPAAAPKAEAPKAEAPKAEAPKEPAKHEGRIMASPAAKKLAGEKGIDLAEITGTGPNGRILKTDVEDYAAKKKEAPKPAPAAAPKPKPEVPGMPEYTDLELTNYKRVAAERLTEAKQTVPHFYVTVDCEVDSLLKLREQLNKHSKSKISINDMLVKACALTCLKVPAANSAWMGTHIREYKDVDMCVAVQTPIGLIAPIVPRANQKGFEQIAKDTKAMIEKAKDGKLKPEEFIGGTFTISNAGMFGISQLISIVNPPQACILGVSQVEKKLVVDEAKIATDKPWRIASKLTVTLSCDHRVVDGAVASEWTKEFKKLIENPSLMMLQPLIPFTPPLHIYAIQLYTSSHACYLCQ
eukprot:TRINITY_DN136_c0_g5_i2.p2 TRINITY_DN136_c0_g5~~TRINITY_DN136_c0_g5_i2.p2  ORF type:complete len:506 (-),score=70.63 TRINITY_DN136_c0_g5_i2:3743-5260(-)